MLPHEPSDVRGAGVSLHRMVITLKPGATTRGFTRVFRFWSPEGLSNLDGYYLFMTIGVLLITVSFANVHKTSTVSDYSDGKSHATIGFVVFVLLWKIFLFWGANDRWC